MPPEREFSRKVALVVGGGSGIGREVALQMAQRGAHVVVADLNAADAESAWADAAKLSSSEMGRRRRSISRRARPSPRPCGPRFWRSAASTGGQHGGDLSDAGSAAAAAEPVWARTLHLNVTGNFVLAQEAARVLQAQKLPASIVLTSSANAVVPKSGSEAYDVSKAAINHLIRELAVGLGPLVRVNGIAPATVVAGSSMFPRDRVIVALKKYDIAFADDESTEELRSKLAEFYAQRTITRRPILPQDYANAICWLAGDESAKTTGHVIPVDGGLPEAFLR